MEKKLTLLVYPVNDAEKAKTFYSKYVGYKLGNLEIGLDPNAEIGPIGYTDVADIQASLAEMTAVGAELVQEVRDVGNGLLIAQVRDAGGNVVGLRQQP
jgi:predicted enzyme related to lactoylglutathione lyase